MEPLPIDGLPDSSPVFAPSECDFEDFDPYEAEDVGAKIIAGPWPTRAPVATSDAASKHGPYAAWGQRALAALIDASVFVPGAVAVAISPLIGGLLLFTAVALSVWQMCVLQGRTGQTIGKNCLGLRLVQEATGAPIGVRRAGWRLLAHAIDAALLGAGYLWPLWDAKRQTFADQLFDTVVVVI
jgi:uncharacterized RDD family membrane protein YckC